MSGTPKLSPLTHEGIDYSFVPIPYSVIQRAVFGLNITKCRYCGLRTEYGTLEMAWRTKMLFPSDQVRIRFNCGCSTIVGFNAALNAIKYLIEAGRTSDDEP